jgi:hypothetical protein
MKKNSARAGKNDDVEVLKSIATLAELAEKDGANSRVFFAGLTMRSGIIPIADLLTLVIRPGSHKREYDRFSKNWPMAFEVAARVSRVPRYLGVALAGVLDGVMYLGTDEIRWSPLKPGEQRKPLYPEAEGACPGATCHDLMERDLRRARALHPGKSRRQRMTALLMRVMFDPKVCGEDLEPTSHLEPPKFLSSITLPYQKFRIRQDATDAVARAEHVIEAHSAGKRGVNESGANMLLRVNYHANEGAWLNELFTEQALFTGMFRLQANGKIECRKEVPVGYEGDVENIKGLIGENITDRPCELVAETTYCEDPTDKVNEQLDKLFAGPSHHVRFEPTVGKEWALIREGQPLWLPLGTPKKLWTPAELAAHPRYFDLCLLAALATVKMQGKMAYALFSVAIGSAAWADLDSVPRVQLIRQVAGLCHYSNGIRCDLSRLDIEAHLKTNRAVRKVGSS